jgi:hypothetical protein
VQVAIGWPVALVLVVALAAPPRDRVDYVKAVTEPLYQCDAASAPVQVDLCPRLSLTIQNTAIPRHFHGSLRTVARELRTASVHCAWTIRAGALHFLRTSDSVYAPAVTCEGQVATLVTRLYAQRS